MRKLVEKILKSLTKAVLRKQKPRIVTITGSVGKTSTREAVYHGLKNKFKVRRSQKNYNNEIGVPMTVIGERTPGKNIFSWLMVFFKFFKLVLFVDKDFPEVLVLEIAADKPGDLKYLMEMLPGDLIRAGILTAVAESHLEFFGDIEGVFQEKITPFFYLTASGYIIVNKDTCDFEKIKDLTMQRGAGFISYSILDTADVMAQNIEVKEQGISFNIKEQNNSAEFLLESGIAKHQIYALLAGVSAGIALDVSFSDIISGIKNYNVLPGRLRKIQGIKNSLIIDDTYNSSPLAVKKALQSLSQINYGKRKIAVLGDMLEMGFQSQELHQEIGRLAVEFGIDYIFTIGTEAEHIFQAAITSGFNQNNAKKFKQQTDLIYFLLGFIEQGDVILVKASQGIRLEKVVKAIMESPELAPSHLARQDKKWLNKS